MRAWKLTLAVVILLSFLFRYDRIGQMTTEHDWLTSHTVLITRIWQMTGLARAHYAPISTWPNDADRFLMRGVDGALLDAEGHHYFLSFPPLGFYVSYAFFQLTGEGASALPLRILMVLIAAASAIPLARLLSSETEAAGWVAAACGVFLLSPVSLLNFGRSLFPLILSIPIWVITTCLFVRLRAAERVSSVAMSALGALCFALCYTDWLGYLACLAYFVLWRGGRLIVAVSSAAALMLTLIQYAAIAGWQAMFATLGQRFATRSGLAAAAGDTSQISNFQTYKKIVFNYWVGFWPILAAAALLGLMLLLRRRRIEWRRSPYIFPLLIAFGVPVAFDNLLLLNHTANHRYAILKAAPLAGIVLGLLFAANLRDSTRGARSGLWALLALAAIGCRLEFRHFRTEPEVAALTGYLQYKVGLGRVLFLEASPVMPYLDPAAFAIAERNVKLVASREEARAFLRTRPGLSGHYIWFATADPASITGEVLQP